MRGNEHMVTGIFKRASASCDRLETYKATCFTDGKVTNASRQLSWPFSLLLHNQHFLPCLVSAISPQILKFSKKHSIVEILF